MDAPMVNEEISRPAKARDSPLYILLDFFFFFNCLFSVQTFSYCVEIFSTKTIMIYFLRKLSVFAKRINGNFNKFIKGSPIADNVDLKSDEFMTPGRHYCVSDGTARTLINCPLRTAFVLDVEYGNGTYFYIRQTFKQNHSGTIIVRNYHLNQNAWTKEEKYVTETL